MIETDTSFAISVFNLMNAILGSGILGLAYAMAQLGVILFFVLSVIVAFFALYAIHLLLIMCDMTGVKAYEKLGFRAFGLGGRILAACCILIQNIGSMCSYLFIIKYELPNLLQALVGSEVSKDNWYLNGDYLVVLVTLAIIMPLAALKNIEFLGYTSGFSISCMFFFLVVVVVKKFSIPCPLFDPDILEQMSNQSSISSHHSPDDVTEFATSLIVDVTQVTTLLTGNDTLNRGFDENMHGNPLELLKKYGPQECGAKPLAVTTRWAYSIPTMTFSFVCHTAVLPIYAELKRPSALRMQKVANISIGICFLVYAITALFGYLTFYNWMEAEMLLMYSYSAGTDALTMVVRLTVLMAVTLTLPLTHFPARKALTFIIFPNKSFQWKIHLGLMLVLLTIVNILVIFMPSIREVFGIIGATSSTMLVFVLPCIFFIKLDSRAISSPKKISAAVICVIGIGLMIETLTVIFIGYSKHDEDL